MKENMVLELGIGTPWGRFEHSGVQSGSKIHGEQDVHD